MESNGNQHARTRHFEMTAFVIRRILQARYFLMIDADRGSKFIMNPLIRLHLHEDNRLPFARDDVDFSSFGFNITTKNRIAMQGEVGSCRLFAFFADFQM